MSNNDVLNIGARLRAARRKQKLSLRVLASRADVSPSLLSQIENGRANPSVMTLHNVASALAVPITFFFPTPNDNGTQPSQANTISSDKSPSELRAANQGEFDVPAQFQSPVINPSSRLAIELMGGVRWERLTPREEDNIQFLEIHYRPGASSGSAMSRHQGREFGIILAGVLKLELGFDQYVLNVGDSIIFDSTTPHRLSNEGEEVVRAIWIIMNQSG
ncbi:MAG: cupin domain-containing protein [Chloroflexi bacterium]|nr:cupin domain-containing protein [Chloroflexota bacterium]